MPSRRDKSPRGRQPGSEIPNFEEVVGRYQNELFGTAIRILGDRALAEDALQDTFMKAYKALASLEPGSNVRAWLYRILVNTTYDLLDRQKTHARAMDAITAAREDELRRNRAGAEERREHLRRTVERAIRSLPAKYRDALVLRAIQDLPYTEIAKVLDIPEATARSLVHRGKSLLLPKLGELVRPDG